MVIRPFSFTLIKPRQFYLTLQAKRMLEIITDDEAQRIAALQQQVITAAELSDKYEVDLEITLRQWQQFLHIWRRLVLETALDVYAAEWALDRFSHEVSMDGYVYMTTPARSYTSLYDYTCTYCARLQVSKY